MNRQTNRPVLGFFVSNEVPCHHLLSHECTVDEKNEQITVSLPSLPEIVSDKQEVNVTFH